MALSLTQAVEYARRGAASLRGCARREARLKHLAVLRYLKRLQALEAAVAAQPAGVRDEIEAKVKAMAEETT